MCLVHRLLPVVQLFIQVAFLLAEQVLQNSKKKKVTSKHCSLGHTFYDKSKNQNDLLQPDSHMTICILSGKKLHSGLKLLGFRLCVPGNMKTYSVTHLTEVLPAKVIRLDTLLNPGLIL